MNTTSNGSRVGDISYLFIFVFDLDRMLKFYHDLLGLEVLYFEKNHYAFLASDANSKPQLALYAGRDGKSKAANNHWFFAFDIADVKLARRTLLSSGVEVGEIEEVPSGLALKLSDPEGNIVELLQSLPTAGK